MRISSKTQNFSVNRGRFLYLYDTWIVCIGFPLSIMIFTIMMMLHLTKLIDIPVSFIYLVMYIYLLLILPFLSLPFIYIHANTRKQMYLRFHVSSVERLCGS